jgi:hypothetical protein
MRHDRVNADACPKRFLNCCACVPPCIGVGTPGAVYRCSLSVCGTSFCQSNFCWRRALHANPYRGRDRSVASNLAHDPGDHTKAASLGAKIWAFQGGGFCFLKAVRRSDGRTRNCVLKPGVKRRKVRDFIAQFSDHSYDHFFVPHAFDAPHLEARFLSRTAVVGLRFSCGSSVLTLPEPGVFWRASSFASEGVVILGAPHLGTAALSAASAIARCIGAPSEVLQPTEFMCVPRTLCVEAGKRRVVSLVAEVWPKRRPSSDEDIVRRWRPIRSQWWHRGRDHD